MNTRKQIFKPVRDAGKIDYIKAVFGCVCRVLSVSDEAFFYERKSPFDG